MSWASDGTNIHPQKTLIGDFIWNISGMKRFQPVIFVIRRIVGSDINSTFFEWVLLTVILLQYQFDISPVSSFTQKLTALSSFYKCWCNSLVVGELWDFDVLRKWGGSEIFLSPGSFNFWFCIWFCGDEGDFLQVSQRWKEWWIAWKSVKAWAPPCVNEEDFLQTLHMIWW